MEHTIIILSLFYIFYHISGLATTNILRLSTGNTLPILASQCTCDICKAKISVPMQLPIISYILCKGKCKSCGTKLPVFALLLEIVIFLGMCIISVLSAFSLTGAILCFVYYEVVRIIVILIKGKRENQFVKQYIIAVASMLPFYGCVLFVTLLYSVV